MVPNSINMGSNSTQDNQDKQGGSEAGVENNTSTVNVATNSTLVEDGGWTTVKPRKSSSDKGKRGKKSKSSRTKQPASADVQTEINSDEDFSLTGDKGWDTLIRLGGSFSCDASGITYNSRWYNGGQLNAIQHKLEKQILPFLENAAYSMFSNIPIKEHGGIRVSVCLETNRPITPFVKLPRGKKYSQVLKRPYAGPEVEFQYVVRIKKDLTRCGDVEKNPGPGSNPLADRAITAAYDSQRACAVTYAFNGCIHFCGLLGATAGPGTYRLSAVATNHFYQTAQLWPSVAVMAWPVASGVMQPAIAYNLGAGAGVYVSPPEIGSSSHVVEFKEAMYVSGVVWDGTQSTSYAYPIWHSFELLESYPNQVTSTKITGGGGKSSDPITVTNKTGDYLAIGGQGIAFPLYVATAGALAVTGSVGITGAVATTTTVVGSVDVDAKVSNKSSTTLAISGDLDVDITSVPSCPTVNANIVGFDTQVAPVWVSNYSPNAPVIPVVPCAATCDTVPQASVFVEDLTTEGVEPNPGPTPRGFVQSFNVNSGPTLVNNGANNANVNDLWVATDPGTYTINIDKAYYDLDLNQFGNPTNGTGEQQFVWRDSSNNVLGFLFRGAFSYYTPNATPVWNWSANLDGQSFTVTMQAGDKITSIYSVNVFGAVGGVSIFNQISGCVYVAGGAGAQAVRVVGFDKQSAPLWTSSYSSGAAPVNPESTWIPDLTAGGNVEKNPGPSMIQTDPSISPGSHWVISCLKRSRNFDWESKCKLVSYQYWLEHFVNDLCSDETTLDTSDMVEGELAEAADYGKQVLCDCSTALAEMQLPTDSVEDVATKPDTKKKRSVSPKHKAEPTPPSSSDESNEASGTPAARKPSKRKMSRTEQQECASKRVAKMLLDGDGSIDWHRMTWWLVKRQPSGSFIAAVLRELWSTCCDVEKFHFISMVAIPNICERLAECAPVYDFIFTLWNCYVMGGNTPAVVFPSRAYHAMAMGYTKADDVCTPVSKSTEDSIMTMVSRLIHPITALASDCSDVKLDFSWCKEIATRVAEPITPAPMTIVDGATAAEAERHNSEQHALNGNIAAVRYSVTSTTVSNGDSNSDLSRCGSLNVALGRSARIAEFGLKNIPPGLLSGTACPKSGLETFLASKNLNGVEPSQDNLDKQRHFTSNMAVGNSLSVANFGADEVDSARHNREMHALNGNMSTEVTSASSNSAPNQYTWKSVAECPEIVEYLANDGKEAEKYLDHNARIKASQQSYGAVFGSRLKQSVKNAGTFRMIRTSTLPVTATGVTVATPLSPLTVRNINNVVTTFNMSPINTQVLSGLGFNVTASSYANKVISKVSEMGMTARISSVEPDTLFNLNDEATIASDTVGCDRFNPEMIAAKAYIDIARMAVYQPDAQYSDLLVAAASPVLASNTLENAFLVNRAGFPVAEQYGYTVGAGVAIGASAVCGQDAVISLHTSYTTAIAPRQVAGVTSVSVPIQVNLRLLSCLGPQGAGKVLAILGSLIAPHPIVPIGYRTDVVAPDTPSLFTHNLERVRLPGLTDIRFYLPQNVRSDGKVPGSTAEANQQAFLRPAFGGCATLNGTVPWAGVGPASPTVAGKLMDYIGLDVATSDGYNLTALWASYMNSQAPITLQDYMKVLVTLEPNVPLLNCMKFVGQLLDSQTWLVKPLLPAVAGVVTPVYPSVSADVTRVRYDATPLPVNTAAFSLYDSLLKPFSRMMAGHMNVENAAQKWAKSLAGPSSVLGVFEGPVAVNNQYFPMYGWATFMAHAAAHQCVMYVAGRNGTDINAAANAYTSSSPQLIAFARALDATQLGIDMGVNSDTQVALEVAYSAVTGGCKPPRDYAGHTLFGRRYCGFDETPNVPPFVNPSFIPATLSISDIFYFCGKMLKEYAPYPVADILNKSIYLPMGNEFSILSVPARAVGSGTAAFLIRRAIQQAAQERIPFDGGAWTDGTDMYNYSLWAASLAAGAARVFTSVTNVQVTADTLLYSSPITPASVGQTTAVECKSMWPRVFGSELCVLYAPATANNDSAIMSDYSQGVTQPRATWSMTPVAYRPNAVYSVGPAMPSLMSKIVAARAARSTETVTGVVPTADPLGVLTSIVKNATLAVTGGEAPVGVMQTHDGVINSGSVPVGAGGDETSSGSIAHPTLSGRADGY